MRRTSATIAPLLALATLAPAAPAKVPDDPPSAAALRMQQAGPTPPAPVLARLLEERARSRNVIGVHVGDVGDALAAHLGLESGRGILVTSVAEGMPAAEAGVRAHDVIVAVDGEEARGRESLSRALRGKDADDTIELTVVRRGEEVRVTVGVMDAPEPPLEQLGGLGYLFGERAAAKDSTRRRLEELETELARTRAVQADREQDLHSQREALEAERAALRARLEQQEAERVARRNLGEIERAADAEEAAAVADRVRREKEIAELRAQSTSLARALDRNLHRLEATRERLATDRDVLRAEAAERLAAAQALLARAPDDGPTREAVDMLREQQEAALSRYQQALERLRLPELRMEGRAGLLVDGTTGREDPSPSYDGRLRAIEDRLANVERLLKQLIEQRKSH